MQYSIQNKYSIYTIHPILKSENIQIEWKEHE